VIEIPAQLKYDAEGPLFVMFDNGKSLHLMGYAADIEDAIEHIGKDIASDADLFADDFRHLMPTLAAEQANQRETFENMRKFTNGEPTGQVSMQTFTTMFEMLGAFVAAETKAAADDPDGGPTGEDMAPMFAMLIDTLPRFGSIEGWWKLTCEPDEGDPGSEFVKSNVATDFDYYVNGTQLQFMCAQGRCTVEPA
jgi:hypothetical protein